MEDGRGGGGGGKTEEKYEVLAKNGTRRVCEVSRISIGNWKVSGAKIGGETKRGWTRGKEDVTNFGEEVLGGVRGGDS